jgi:hypothetical protein
MLTELNGAECWSDFMSRMASQFEQLVEAKPTCVEDMVRELKKRDESVTFVDALRDRVPEMRKAKPETLPRKMQIHGYYASLQGPWLVCSKSKRRHDAMLFAAQASQALANANMMLVPIVA